MQGRMQPKVAQRAPEKPAIFGPTKVAELIAIGPGVIWEIVTRSVTHQAKASGADPPPAPVSKAWPHSRRQSRMHRFEGSSKS